MRRFEKHVLLSILQGKEGGGRRGKLIKQRFNHIVLKKKNVVYALYSIAIYQVGHIMGGNKNVVNS